MCYTDKTKIKGKLFFSCQFFARATGLLLLIVFSFISCDTDPLSKKTDEFIKVEKLGEQAILVSLGVDAVSAIETQKGIIVIDAGISNSLTAEYRKIIEHEFKRTDFAYLINTHSHSDHTGGNQVFSDAMIIGHANCLPEMSEEWKSPEKKKSGYYKIAGEYNKALQSMDPGSEEWTEAFSQELRYQHAWNDLANDRVLTKPSLTFEDSLTLFMGDATVNMFYFGHAHSGSDILIHIPEDKILFTGDLFFPGGRASIDSASKQDVEQWKTAMQWLWFRWNDIDKVIGGHGQIMTLKDLEAFNKYVNRK
jgi:glyoxylase-like metal-dependent hydrolase (beta-lactamase superfamily II)